MKSEPFVFFYLGNTNIFSRERIVEIVDIPQQDFVFTKSCMNAQRKIVYRNWKFFVIQKTCTK